jgi:hypothetical protein
MLGTVVDRITIADFHLLVTDKVPEGKTIEYKKELHRLDAPAAEVSTTAQPQITHRGRFFLWAIARGWRS